MRAGPFTEQQELVILVFWQGLAHRHHVGEHHQEADAQGPNISCQPRGVEQIIRQVGKRACSEASVQWLSIAT